MWRGIESGKEAAPGDQGNGNKSLLTWQRGVPASVTVPWRRGRPRTLGLNWRKQMESSFLGLVQDVEYNKILIL